MIVGSRVIIDRAIRVRKVLGGGWRQAGVLAAAALYALDHQVERMSEDHNHANMMVNTINAHGQGKFTVVSSGVMTNLVLIRVDPSVATPDAVVAKLEAGIYWIVNLLHWCSLHHIVSAEINEKVGFS